MTFVVLFSTMSFTIDMHYCGNTLVDIAIFKQAKTCEMKMQKSSSNSECSITKKDCCNDEQVVFEGQDELNISLDKLTLSQKIFTSSIAYSSIHGFEALEEKPNLNNEYPPPLFVKNIYKLHEVYLI